MDAAEAVIEPQIARPQLIGREQPRSRSPDISWYVLRIISRSDKLSIRCLYGMKFQFYYPLVLEMRKLKMREMSAAQRAAGIEIRRPKPVAMFPRYCFARFDIRTDWRRAFDIAGITGLVCEGGMPVKIADDCIDRIRGWESDRGHVPGNIKTRLVFNVGDRVRIRSGPFAEHEVSIVEALDLPIEEVDPILRIKVACNLFGRSTKLELDAWQVEE